MLRRTDGQDGVWDVWFYDRLVPKDHLLMKIDRVVDFSFVEEQVQDLYSPNMGRPSCPPEKVVRMMFVAFLYNLSDVAIADEISFNLAYRRFCRFSLDENTPDDSTLVVFRRRLGEERFMRLFDQVVKQAQDQGLFEGKRKMVDATVMRADTALRNRVDLLRHGRKKVLQAVKKRVPDQHGDLVSLGEAAERTKEMSWQEVTAAEEAVTDGMLSALGDVDDPEVGYWAGELKKVRDGDGGVASFVDTDCRWGHKRKDEPFLGYKAHASCDESGIVTSVQVFPGNESECEHLPELLEQDQAKGVPARSVVADKAYDSGTNREKIREMKMRPEIPVRYRGKQAFEFRYRPRKDCFQCAGGKETIGKSKHKAGYLYYFSQSDCQRCQRRQECLGHAETRKRVYLSDRAKDALRHRQDLSDALRTRKAIERKFGEAKLWHAMHRARYRRRWKVAVQVLMTFMVMNAKRMVRLLEQREAQLEPG